MVNVQDGKANFRFFRPDVKSVFIVGDFNDWRQDQIHMNRDSSGYWTATLDLPAGVYKFRYLADGKWFTDYAAFGVEPGDFGMDSVLNIEACPIAIEFNETIAAAA